MRVIEGAGIYHDGDAYICPECTTPYPSVSAAASCDCGDEE